MPIENLIKDYGSLLEIKFQSTVDLESFEYLLVGGYSKSKKTKFREVLFNFQLVTWFEPFQVSQVAQWILEIRQNGKTIKIKRPQSHYVNAFLHHYNFFQTLVNHGRIRNPGTCHFKDI